MPRNVRKQRYRARYSSNLSSVTMTHQNSIQLHHNLFDAFSCFAYRRLQVESLTIKCLFYIILGSLLIFLLDLSGKMTFSGPRKASCLLMLIAPVVAATSRPCKEHASISFFITPRPAIILHVVVVCRAL